MARVFEEAESRADFYDICRASDDERRRAIAFFKSSQVDLLQGIQEKIQGLDPRPLLVALAFEQNSRIRPTNEVPISDFVGQARFLRGIIIERGGCGSCSFRRANRIVQQELELCTQYWEMLLEETNLDELGSGTELPSRRAISLGALRIQSLFEGDVRYGKHERELVESISPKLNRHGLQAYLGYDIANVFTILDKTREIVKKRMKAAQAAGASTDGHMQDIAFEALQYQMAVSHEELGEIPDVDAILADFTATTGQHGLELARPSKESPILKYLFWNDEKHGTCVVLDMQYAEHAVRRRLESRLMADEKLKRRYLVERNKYIESRSIVELSTILKCKPLAKNYYIKDSKGHLAERDAIWIVDKVCYILEAKDVKPRDVIKSGLQEYKRLDDIQRGLGKANQQAEDVSKSVRSGKLEILCKYGRVVDTVDTTGIEEVHKIIATGDDYQHNAADPSDWLETDPVGTPWVIDVFSLAIIDKVFRKYRRQLSKYLQWKRNLYGKLENGDELEVVGAFAVHGAVSVEQVTMVNFGMSYADVFDVEHFRELGYDVPDVEADPKAAFAIMGRDGNTVFASVRGGKTHRKDVRQTDAGAFESKPTKVRRRVKQRKRKK